MIYFVEALPAHPSLSTLIPRWGFYYLGFQGVCLRTETSRFPRSLLFFDSLEKSLVVNVMAGTMHFLGKELNYFDHEKKHDMLVVFLPVFKVLIHPNELYI